MIVPDKLEYIDIFIRISRRANLVTTVQLNKTVWKKLHQRDEVDGDKLPHLDVSPSSRTVKAISPPMLESALEAAPGLMEQRRWVCSAN